MTEKKAPPTKKIKWGNLQLVEWDNTYTYEGKVIAKNGYEIQYNIFDKEKKNHETLSHVKIDSIYDLSIIKYFIDRCKAGKIKAKFPMNQYSIEQNEEGHYEIKNHYKTKEGVEGNTCLTLKFRHDILHLSDLLERSLAILMKPSKIYKSENSASNMPNDENNQSQPASENEFVDETSDDEIPF